MSVARLLLLVLTALGTVGPTALVAQDEASATEGPLYLLLPVGAKGVGVARAMTALGGAESVWWNPAGLASVERSRIMVTRSEEEIAGEGTSLTGLLHKPGLGVLGLSYLLLDVGEVALRDDQGNFLGQVSFRYHTGVLSGAATMLGAVGVGMNLKVIQSRLTCRGQCLDGGVTATTWAVDLGAQWREAWGSPLTLGAAVVHAGPGLQVVNEAQADPLPTRVRLAAAYDVLRHWVEIPHIHGRVALELEDRWRGGGDPATYLGLDLGAGTDPAISLRAGYAWGADLQVDGAGVGIALQYEQFDLGISKSLSSGSLNSNEPVHITLGFVFR